jgi:hypothetical protein
MIDFGLSAIVSPARIADGVAGGAERGCGALIGLRKLNSSGGV